MANYQPYNANQYSLLDVPEFKSSYQGSPSSYIQQPQQESMMDPSTARAAAYGAQNGGISGALTAGGVSSLLSNGASAGGPYAIAGGLILSQIEAAQKAKQAQEDERVANEKNRMNKMQQAYANNANLRFGI